MKRLVKRAMQPVMIALGLFIANAGGLLPWCGVATGGMIPQIGEKRLRFSVSSRLSFLQTPTGAFATYDFPTATCSFVFNFKTKAVAGGNIGSASVDLIATRSSCDPTTIPGVATICARPKSDGRGILCCNPQGCGFNYYLGSPSYTLDANHDSSGNRPGFFFENGRALDPNCSENHGVVIGGVCVTSSGGPASVRCGKDADCDPQNAEYCLGPARSDRSIACREDLDCNAFNIGLATQGQNPHSHYALLPHVCNSTSNLFPGTDAFGPGDMVVAYPLEVIMHTPASQGGNGGLDDVKDNVTGNPVPDGIPDGYGPDGLPCTDDDTTQPLPVLQQALTTHVAHAIIYNANMNANTLSLPNLVLAGEDPSGQRPPQGAVPAGACTQLTLGDATGYRLMSSTPAFDGQYFGDAVVVLQYDGLAP
jgi:hypothetical protein